MTTNASTTTTDQHPECLICSIWIGDVEGDDLESSHCADCAEALVLADEREAELRNERALAS